MDRSFSPNSLKILKTVRDKGDFCDAVLKTEDGGEFQIHKCILASFSSYFESLFTADEKCLKQKIFVLPNINKETLEVIIKYVYEGSLNLNPADISDIFAASIQYCFHKLTKDCYSFLNGILDPKNCIWILRLAIQYKHKKLEVDAKEYIMEHFMAITKNCKDFMSLTIEELVPLLKNERLNVRKEELVWDTILHWIETDPLNRKMYIVQLMKCIRLGLMNMSFFMANVNTHPYIIESSECQLLVKDTIKFFNDLASLDNKTEEIKLPELALPRLPHEVIFAIGGWSEGAPTQCIETFDHKADRWIRMKHVDPSGGRAYHRCVIVKNHIYIIGGYDGTVHFNGCRSFHILTKEWKEIAPMHCKRCYVSAAVLDDIIFAMGGFDGQNRQNSAEKYDYVTNQWTVITPMNFQRSDADATAFNGHIYVVGGFTGIECLQSAEMYSPSDNQWTVITPMRSRRSGVSCIAYNGCIYAFGGFTGSARLKSVEKYNPIFNRWSDMPDMLTTRSNFATAVVDDTIFVIGGYNGESITSQVECFDESSNKWCIVTDMSINRSAVAACAIRGISIIGDYIYKQRDNLLEEKRLRLLEIMQQLEAVD